MRRRFYLTTIEIVLLAATYFCAARLGLSMAYLHVSATAVWPPTGIALAALLWRGYRLWLGIFIGAFLANTLTQSNSLTSLAIAGGNTLEAITGAWLVNRFANGAKVFCSMESIVAFVPCAVFSTLISATVGVTSLAISGFAPWEAFRSVWLTWWLGDLVSDFNVAPFLLVWFCHERENLRWRDLPEAVAIATAVILLGEIVFVSGLRNYPITFLCLPSSIWAAYRFHQRGAVTANLAMSLLAVAGTVRGFGPFTLMQRNETLLLLEAFMGTISLTGLCLAALTAESKRGGEALAWFGAVVRSSHDAIIGKTVDGTITSWNSTAEEIYGYRASEVIGKNISIIVPPERLNELPPLYEKIRRGERVQAFETVRVHKDGHPIHVVLSLSPVKDKSGKIIGISAIGRDMSLSKQAEQVQMESEERLKLAIEAARMGTWEWDIAAQKIHWSPNLEAIHQLPPGTFGGTFEDFVHEIYPEDRDKVLQAIEHALTELQEFRCEYRILRGKEFVWLEGRGRLFLDPDGKPRRMLGVCLDITERKNAEQMLREGMALRASEAHFHELAEAAPLIIYTATPDGRIDYGNRRWYDYTGLTMEQTISLNGFLSVVPHDDWPAVLEKRQQSVRTSQPFQAEHRVRGKDGEYRWFLSRAVAIKDEHGQLRRWVGTLTDIQDQKIAAETLEQFAEELEIQVAHRTGELEKSVKFLQDFLYIIGHHLRAPLRALDGFTKVLLEDYARFFDEAGRENAQRIVSAARRMRELIDALLYFGRLSHEEFPCQRVDLDARVKAALRDFAGEIEQKKADVTVEHPLPSVWANPVAIDQALKNLIGNALKFISPERAPRIEIRAEECESFVRLLIKDNGIGINPNHQTRIFDLFEKLTDLETYPGMGVGLAIVRQAAERMGGAVGVTSEPGVGSTFWLDLPAIAQEKQGEVKSVCHREEEFYEPVHRV